MQTRTIDDYDSTCFDASVSAGHFNNNESVEEYVNAPTRYVEFIHSSLMSESEKEEYIFLDGVWQTIDPTSKFAATKFEEGEIHSPVYWA